MKFSANALTSVIFLATVANPCTGAFVPSRQRSFQPAVASRQASVLQRNMPPTSTTTAIGAHHAQKVYPAIPTDTAKGSLEEYKDLYKESLDPSFWASKARQYLEWYQDFPEPPLQGSLDDGDVTWFAGGKLNVCYNAIDRWARQNPNKVAMISEGDEPDDIRRITYQELQRKVSQIANALKSQGVEQGDVVTIYMPMIPELAMTMLACARIGAVHSVVFAGFSADALAQRINAAKSKVVVTADVSVRGGRTIHLKRDIVNAALERLETRFKVPDLVQKVLVYERFHDATKEPEEGVLSSPRDVRMDPIVALQRPYCPPRVMDAEDDLFILYTSGSTGTPKGLVHTTGGYGLWAAYTTATTFDLQKDDVFACVADCGWITGHTYVVYGPLLNGGTTFLFESTPMYPDAGRYWDMVQRHKINIFYTAPTAIRSLMRYGDDVPAKYNLESLKILGSVGEPINPEAWWWYYQVVGRSTCTVVDTYWQTETGGHIVTNFPGVTPMKPGSCTLPYYGVDTVVLDPASGKVLTDEDQTGGEDGEERGLRGVLAIRSPWPGMARTCLGDHERYMTTYLRPYKGFYFAGDSVFQDTDGYFFITGRVDDVLNVSGHRIGTAEVESALVGHHGVAQAAVVGKPDDVKGQSIFAFCTLTVDSEEKNQDEAYHEQLIKELRQEVRKDIGPFATPSAICITPSLPMTRSGKIMRRILRKIVAGEAETLGDTSTLADPTIVDTLIEMVESKK